MATGVRLPELNQIVLSGNLVRDGEFGTTPSGIPKGTMRMAVNRSVKDSKTGEWKKDAFFIDVIVWQKLAEYYKDKAKKGTPIAVEGRLSGREYDDAKTGQKRTVFEVVATRVQFLTLTGAASDAPKAAASAPVTQSADSDPIEEVPF